MPDQPTENIREVLIEDDMKEAYLRYAMSVIISRALPDIRDGLKPSQRRILYAMHELNLGPTAKHRKCGKIVGDTIGNYHPHGDQAVYPTLVRMGQDFSMRYPLIDGQGNFGSIDADPPAAMRYTEARLSAFGAEMLEDIERETVPFVPNYDETRTEPVVLPGRFPNLICNGSSGIAVGMATSIPPHNLGEVVDALLTLADNPAVTVDGLLEHIRGPDFPTGGYICGRAAIREGYRTGKATITVRGKAEIEEGRSGKMQIVISEIPYQVTRLAIKEAIVAAVEAGRIEGIADVRDETDRTGQRLVVEVKRGADEQVVLNQLYKHTPLQTGFSIILLALVNNTPQTLNLKELLRSYLDYRVEIVKKRTTYLLNQARARAEILEGLKKALAHIDEVIAVIKASANPEVAAGRLIELFQLTENQAQAILQMRLQRLTNLEQEKLNQEYEELLRRIAEYIEILSSYEKTLAVVKAELVEMKQKHADPRRTEILDEVEELTTEDLIPDEPMVVTLTHTAYVKRTPVATYRVQQRGGRGVSGGATREEDFMEYLFTASTHDYLLLFTDRGKCYQLKVYQLPLLPRSSRGRAIVNLIRLQQDERINALLSVREFDERFLFMATSKGIVKKTPLAEFAHARSTGLIAQNLDEGDRVVGVSLTDGSREVILATDDGIAIRFPETQVRAMGRSTRGVTGIRLREGSRVVGMIVPESDSFVLSVSENGFAKRTALDSYRLQRRGGKGIINFRCTEKTGKIVGIMPVRPGDEIMVITNRGMLVRTKTDQVRACGRATSGVRLIRMEDQDKVASVARIAREESQ